MRKNDIVHNQSLRIILVQMLVKVPMASDKVRTLIGYVRVSACRQGRSSLGLEAQWQAFMLNGGMLEGFTLGRIR